MASRRVPANFRGAVAKTTPQKLTIRDSLAQQQPGQAKVVKKA